MFGLFKQHKEKTNVELSHLIFMFLILFYLFPREKNPELGTTGFLQGNVHYSESKPVRCNSEFSI